MALSIKDLAGKGTEELQQLLVRQVHKLRRLEQELRRAESDLHLISAAFAGKSRKADLQLTDLDKEPDRPAVSLKPGSLHHQVVQFLNANEKRAFSVREIAVGLGRTEQDDVRLNGLRAAIGRLRQVDLVEWVDRGVYRATRNSTQQRLGFAGGGNRRSAHAERRTENA